MTKELLALENVRKKLAKHYAGDAEKIYEWSVIEDDLDIIEKAIKVSCRSAVLDDNITTVTMNKELAKAYCKDYIYLDIPQNKEALCYISIRHHRIANPITDYDDIWSSCLINRQVAIALKTLIEGE